MCTRTHHDHLVATAWGSLLNSRPWPSADLEIAECPKCKSTLARELVTQDDILTRELAIAAREGLEWELCRVWLRAEAIKELREEMER